MSWQKAEDPECGTDGLPLAVETVIVPRARDLGGVEVRRVLPSARRKTVGPFIFFDQMGPLELLDGNGPEVRPHPHIGLATVTYLFEGAIAHRDTVGSDIVIRPGAVNWMTAGRGIVHSERTPAPERAAGQSLHGIQTWVALPKSHETAAPDFTHHPARTLPVFELGGARLRTLAGSAWGHASPVSFPHPIWYVVGEAEGAAEFVVPADAAEERAVYVARGTLRVGAETLPAGSMAVMRPGCAVTVRTDGPAAFMLAGGGAMPEKRLIEWNLVASEPGLIAKARADWQDSIERGWQGSVFTLPDGEDEWIPLPDGL